MDRINQAHLQAVCDRINRVTSSPMSPYIRNQDTQSLVAQIGNYHLSGAYGGVSLHRMVSEGGGVSDVFRCGHIPKRDLYNRMHAFLAGIDHTNGE